MPESKTKTAAPKRTRAPRKPRKRFTMPKWVRAVSTSRGVRAVWREVFRAAQDGRITEDEAAKIAEVVAREAMTAALRRQGEAV